MSFLKRFFIHTITVFSKSLNRYGEPTWSSSQFKGRWENKITKAVDFEGVEFMSNAVVYSDVNVNVGDYLYKGSSSASTPPDDSREVKVLESDPSLDGSKVLNKYKLR